MESVAVFPDGEWEVDFAQQVMQQFTFPDSVGLSFINTSPVCPVTVSEMTISGVNESLMYYNSQESSQSSNSSGSDFVSPTSHENFYVSDNNFTVTNDINMPLDISMDDKVTGLFPYIAMEDPTLNLIEDLCLAKLDASLQPAEELPINKKKRPRVAKDAMKVMKNQKISLHCNESTYSSEDDNVSQDGVANSDSKPSQALNLNGKARASRGSATDPQSLYARKRRERINERLRILQNLVPNGTKVDISTMLEEAVHYVKFLQLQIKILSSDDLWMYAPIAYNGIDISLNDKISTLL